MPLQHNRQIQQTPQPQQTFNHEAQTLIASTIREIDQLSDIAISQLASQFQQKIKCDLMTEKSVVYHQDKQQNSQQLLKCSIQQTISQLIQVKFHLTLLLQLYLKDKSHNQAIKEIQQDIKKFRKSILLMESQMSMISWILENKHKHDIHFRQKYQQKFSQLQQFSIPIESLHQQNGFVNKKMIIQALQTIKQILLQYVQSIVDLKKSIQKKKRAKYLLRGLNRLCVINAKVLTVSEVMPYCCIVPHDDLFSFDINHPRWQKLISQCIIYRSYADKQTLKESFDNLKKNLNLINATMNIMNRTRKLPLLNLTSWYQFARSSKYLMKILLFKDAAKKQAQYMICSANTQLMKQVWNLPEHKIFRDLAQFLIPSIEHSQRLYIPRIALDYFNENGTSEFPQTKIKYLTQYGNQLFKKKSYAESLRIRINCKFKLVPKFNIIDQKTKYSSQGTGLVVKKIQNVLLTLSNLCSIKPTYVPEKLVFHIHGGGFISMSSFIHQVYTIPWAKELQVPFISVDYGKAPEHPYPQGLYDCLEAYIWTLNCFEQIYEAKPNKIVFVGDSAGGNLAAALINLCIAWKLRVPDGLLMCYPVLSVTSKKYTRSLLGTLEDMILPHTMLKLCQTSYAKNKPSENDPLISPLFTPNQFLLKYPPTKIFVGTKDPFHDDCCRFTEKMNSVSPGKCILTILQEFPHGFLQFDIKTNPHQFGRKANQQICHAIGELLSDEYKPRNEQFQHRFQSYD